MYVKHWCFPTLIFYILLAIIIALLFKKSIKYKKNSDSKFNKKYICYFLIYLIFIIFSCLRVIQPGIGGADTYNYIKYFNTMQYVNFNLKDIVLFNGFEYIFYNLMFFIRIIGGNFYIFMFIIYSTIIL